jgi:hypothetical protein
MPKFGQNDGFFTLPPQRPVNKIAFITQTRQRHTKTTVVSGRRRGGRSVKAVLPTGRGGGTPKRLSFRADTAAASQ